MADLISLPALPDDERVLLLLGLLSAQERHGYEINDFISRQLGCVIDLKKATAYQLLDRLEQHALIASHPAQHGARPTRKVYRLTEAGHAHFLELLKARLAHEEVLILPGSVSLIFCEHLPAAERLMAAQERLAQLEARVAMQERLLELPGLPQSMKRPKTRLLALTRADLEWLRGWVGELERGEVAP
ncbi:PadR family transcriptional regulator [Deinococcus sp.]|uniref:PadR family transcriptional regulator n=1 Tax=Deinococcus sp. TaxID=47478 RepID=UPI0025BEDA2F|nr:PadR family transcriptional regulator [Deinococcus sp.]